MLRPTLSEEDFSFQECSLVPCVYMHHRFFAFREEQTSIKLKSITKKIQ